VYTDDKSDVEIITPLLPSERKSLGPVAELGRSYKGPLCHSRFFDRLLELTLAARTRSIGRHESLLFVIDRGGKYLGSGFNKQSLPDQGACRCNDGAAHPTSYCRSHKRAVHS
jgi:hypothetical protein